MRNVVIACVMLTLGGTVLTGTTAAPDTTWLQWGGPRRNFVVESPPLASSWPASGPSKLWARDLGEGHSAIVADGGRLYTMYRPLGMLSMIRRSQQEIVTAIDATNGRTIWEHTIDSPTAGFNLSEGAGPHSTPLLVGDRLFVMTSRVEIAALDKSTGTRLWYHDLGKEVGAPPDDRGYSSSPIAYRGTVIVPAGGPGASVVAFDQATGAIAWKGGNFPVAPGSPVLISVDGEEQLVVSGAAEIVGVNPANGATLWSHHNKTDYGLNISTPVWGEGNLLFLSAAYNNGARLLKLTRGDGKTTVRELWMQNRMRVHIGSVIRLGDFAVGSSGDFGPCPAVAIDLETGQILWQSREFARSMFLHADGKLIVLDEDGTLGIATATRQGLTVLAKTPVLANRAWTPPTLAGTKLYVRDRKQMIALELGAR